MLYSKDNNNNNTTYNYYSSFANNYSNVSNNMGMMDFNNNHKYVLKPTVASTEYASNVNINNADSMLLVHRRKMQRRAANRRSAQLSRARKKVCLLVLILAALFACYLIAPSFPTHHYSSTTIGSLGGAQNRELTAAAHGGRIGLPTRIGVLHHLVGQDHLCIGEDHQLHQDQLLGQGGE